jgi:hypothetical protein
MTVGHDALAFGCGNGSSGVQPRAIAARTDFGMGRHPHSRPCSTCHAIRCFSVAFFGILFWRCHSEFIFPLRHNDRIAVATRGGADRPGLRISPHFYNLEEEVDRCVAALDRYLRRGV